MHQVRPRCRTQSKGTFQWAQSPSGGWLWKSLTHGWSLLTRTYGLLGWPVEKGPVRQMPGVHSGRQDCERRDINTTGDDSERQNLGSDERLLGVGTDEEAVDKGYNQETGGSVNLGGSRPKLGLYFRRRLFVLAAKPTRYLFVRIFLRSTYSRL